MNKYLKELVELNQYDRDIEKLIPIEESIKKPLTQLETKAKSLEIKLEKLNDEIKNLILKKSKNELLITELKEKLNKIAEKTAKVKTMKEAKALNLEEELAREQIENANDEIGKFEKIVEDKEQEKEEIKKEIESTDAKMILVQAEIQDKLNEIKKRKEDIYKKRDELVKQMDSNIYKYYEKIKKWASISAVSPVKKHACMGCFMKINDKTYADVIKAEEIIACPHCGRVLYIETEEDK
jgi:predicted  nucleic acid-binding Zn-ribbon protein